MIFLQDGEYGRSDLSPHEVDMSQVWFFVKYQLLDFLCRLKVVEIVYQVFTCLKVPLLVSFDSGKYLLKGDGWLSFHLSVK